MALEDTMLKISQTQKVTCCMIPLTRNLQSRHIYRDRKQISDLWGGGGVDRVSQPMCRKFLFGVMKMVWNQRATTVV